MNKHYKHIFEQGVLAKENGWDRDSCPYHGYPRDSYWFAGFDGWSYSDTIAAHKDSQKLKREVRSELGYSRIGLRNV